MEERALKRQASCLWHGPRTTSARSIAWLGCVVVALITSGCDLIADLVRDYDPQLESINGEATATALHVLSIATDTTRTIEAVVATACRAMDPTGPMTVTSTVVLADKTVYPIPTEVVEVRTWRRDLDGNIAARVEVYFELLDGRAQSRSMETRIVDGQGYRAIDDRFVDASRIPHLSDQVSAEAHLAVDELLAFAAMGPTSAVPAEPGRGLCRSTSETGLPMADWVSLRLEPHHRAGWIRWRESDTGRVLIAQFQEHTIGGAEAVHAPDRLWPVDGDQSFTEVENFVALGRTEGWLLTARQPYVQPPVPSTNSPPPSATTP